MPLSNPSKYQLYGFASMSKLKPFYFITACIMLIIENANIPTTTPATPHIKAPLAVATLSGSPLDVKNNTPAIMNIINAKIPKTCQARVCIAVNIDSIVDPPVGICGRLPAKTNNGDIKTVIIDNEMIRFFFIFLFNY